MREPDEGDAARPRTRRYRHTAKEHGPDPIDLRVGAQVRLARELAGLTQTEVGRALGMSFQVVQKYEQGEIRISASRLYRLAVLLNRSTDYFFESVEGPWEQTDAMDRRDIELIRAFRHIPSAELRQLLARLVRDIAAEPSASSEKLNKTPEN